MGVLSTAGLVPQIFSAASGETVHRTTKVLEVQERAPGPLSSRQVWWGYVFTRRRGGQKRSQHCEKRKAPVFKLLRGRF